MRLPDFEYVEPKSIEEAALFLRDNGQESKVIAGGTDLLPSMKQRIFRPKYLLNLCSVPHMDRIEFNDGSGLRIGALVRLRALERDPFIREHYPMIAQAAEAIGSVQLRQMGTVGGNLSLDTRCYYYNQSDFWRSCRPRCIKMGGETCNAGGGKKCFAVFSGDLAPALIALGAKIRLVSASGERSLLLKDFYTGNGAKPLERKPGEFLVSVEVPIPKKDTFTTYLKYRIRKSIDFPLVSVAAMLMMDHKEKVCRGARVVISAVGTRPEEVTRIRDLLLGKKLERPLIEEAAELAFKAGHPVANTASTPSYRKRMIKVLVGRTLKRAAESAV